MCVLKAGNISESSQKWLSGHDFLTGHKKDCKSSKVRVRQLDSSFFYYPGFSFLCRNYTSFFNSAVKVTQSFKQQFRQIDVYVITAANEMCLSPLLLQHKAQMSFIHWWHWRYIGVKVGERMTVVITWQSGERGGGGLLLLSHEKKYLIQSLDWCCWDSSPSFFWLIILQQSKITGNHDQ